MRHGHISHGDERVQRRPDPFGSGADAGPSGVSRRGRALDGLHVRTRAGTVRRQILFSAGDTLDTLAVGESIRRLRNLRYLRDVELSGVRCGNGPVDLVLTTRDDWSVKPKVQVRSGKSEIGVTERNLLGSGRELSLHARSQQGRIGVDCDPFGDPTDLELHIQAHRLAGSESNAFADQWAEPIQFDPNLVRARSEAGNGIGAVLSGDGRACPAG